ncbi:MAG: hypothetical protein WC310_03720 [Patescibacteria group bacterium]|jgi:hypothetical protein
MKDLLSGFKTVLLEMIWFFILQGIFFFAFAIFTLFYPFALVIVVAFFLVCMAVLYIYFGCKIWLIRHKINKFLK